MTSPPSWLRWSSSCQEPDIRVRTAIGIGAGAITAAILFLGWHIAGGAASDWDQVWYAAKALAAGGDPYQALTPDTSPWPLIYPLPAVLLALPYAWMPLPLARVCWFGTATACLAYAWARPPWWRLRGLVSGAFVWAAMGANWTPFLLAGVWLPALSLWWCCKPTTGTLFWIRKAGAIPVVGGAILVTISLVLRPRWPAEWLANIFHPGWGFAYHPIPATLPGGWLLLLALLRWRQPEARLVAAWSLVPSSVMPSELLLGFAVARTKREWMVVTIMSWVVILCAIPFGGATQLVGESPAHAFARWAEHIWPGVLGGWVVLLVMVLSRSSSTSVIAAGPQ